MWTTPNLWFRVCVTVWGVRNVAWHDGNHAPRHDHNEPNQGWVSCVRCPGLSPESEPEVPGGGEVLWLPTACLALLDVLHAVRPNHSLIAADFDVLPGVLVPGRSAPLVAEKVRGSNLRGHN